jgi:SAM-dependent methyltransferase
MNSNANQTATSNDSDEMRFGFGANWADYIQKNFSDERVEISRRHLLGFLKLDDLHGKTFLDIGCGSGLHSLAAWRSGAERVVSFDYDANSVATTRKLHELSASPQNWVVMQGSVLDRSFVDSLPKSDIVYSWGVLHHTGSMWEAIENAASCMQDNSVFYIALYSKDVYVSPPYEYWLDVKRTYNLATPLKKRWMEWQYAWRDCIRSYLARGKNPISFMKAYKQSRGMSYWHDVKDWLGGYPMEFAGNKETEIFGRNKLGIELIHVKAGEGNTEFLFKKLGEQTYWSEVSNAVMCNPISGKFDHVAGFCWKIELLEEQIGNPEKLMLYENESPIGWPNSLINSIQEWGRGRYCVVKTTLFFSTTDNRDPNTSGKTYSFRADYL